MLNKDELYQKLLAVFPAEELDKWYASLGIGGSDEVLSVRFPHAFFADWFDRNARDRFERALNGSDAPSRIEYCLREGNTQTIVAESAPRPVGLPFGSDFSFDNFMVNSKNFFPLASAREVADSQDVQYNPFVLCGESGAGKSFLLRAIANAKSELGSENMLVAGIEDLHELYASRSDARNYLTSLCFLAVDDLQDIAKYQYLQSEMIALFDHYHLNKKQMVFACTGKVSAYSFLQPKLKSRLEWGLIVTLKAPDLDIRTQYAVAKCKERRIELSKDRMLLLAQRFNDLRNLEGCLLKLWAYRELVREQISDEEFGNILNYLDDRSATVLTPDQILTTVCEEFKVSREDLFSAGRKQSLVFARQVGMYLCRKHLGLSFPELGRIFGGRDHSTVLYSYRKIEQLQRDDKSVKNLLNTLSDRCLALDTVSHA